MNVSIIIKAYNEEKNIRRSIESAIKAIKGIDGEVIMVDSLSLDNTVAIAQKYPIKIIQLSKKSFKTPAAALEVGYRASKGNYVLALDGDMALDKNFIKKALPLFNDKSVAAIGGLIQEPHAGNILSGRAQRYYENVQTGHVKYLDGGGIYRRSAIEEVGHLSNPFLFSAEESELGFELTKCNYKILRMPISYVTHYFDKQPTAKILLRQWKTGYMYGFGQVLRLSIKSGYFFDYLIKLNIYVCALIVLLLFGTSLLSLYFTKVIFAVFSFFAITIAIFLLIKKKSLVDLLFSLFVWSLRSIGILIGFCWNTKKSSEYKYKYTVIK